MAGSLREALNDAIKTEETKTPAPAAPAPASEPAAPAPAAAAASLEAASTIPEGESAPAAKPAEPAAPVAAAPADAKPDESAQPVEKPGAPPAETAEEKAAHRVDRPPQGWRKEAKGEWANLPLHIRQEVHKRENEINRVLAQSAPDRQLADNFKKIVNPFMARLQANQTDPLTAAQNLFQADYVLATAPKQKRAQFMAQLIREYDIDIAELDGALAGSAQSGQPGQPAQQPDIAEIVQQQLQQALAPLMQERQQAVVRSQQEVTQSVEQMALDPKYPYFEDVREDMADLIDIAARKGVALSLEDAYHRAVRMNPDTFGQLERQSTMTIAQQQHQQATRARAASSSISGAPAGGGGQSNTGDGSLRGAIEAAFGGQRL